MPGLGRTILAVLLPTGQARGLKAHEVWQPLRRRDYHALRNLSGVAPVTRRSGKPASLSAVMPAISGFRTRSIIGRASEPSTTLSSAAVMPRYAGAAIDTAAPAHHRRPL